MAKKRKTEGITSTKIVRQLPVAFEADDAMLQGHYTELTESYIQLFPFSHQIAKLEELAKPIKKTIKETLDKIEGGTTEKVDCTKTIEWAAGTVEITRDDTGEIVEKREIGEEDTQQEADL